MLALRTEKFLNCTISSENIFDIINQPLLAHKINDFTPLLKRIEQSDIETMINQSSKIENTDTNTDTNTDAKLASLSETISDEISINDFSKIDLRVALVVNAALIEGADKLLQLTLDIGSEKRNVFAGIKSAYTPEELIGRNVIMIANLASRKMQFGLSEGMVLAASGIDDDDGIFLIGPDSNAQPGMRVR
jgi:methionyl-tRNA synthetase